MNSPVRRKESQIRMSQTNTPIVVSVRIPKTVFLPEKEYELIKGMLALRIVEVLERAGDDKVFFSPIKQERFRRFDDETEFRLSVEWGFIETVRLTTADLPEYPKMGFWRRLRFLFLGR